MCPELTSVTRAAEHWADAHGPTFTDAWYDHLEYMGVSVPLLRLVEDADVCPWPRQNETESLRRKGIYSYARFGHPQIATRLVSAPSVVQYARVDDLADVRVRNHVYIVNETRPFPHRAFETAHSNLKKNAVRLEHPL